MSWLFRHNWAWSLAAFLLGALITWLLLDRRTPATPAEEHAEEPAKEEALVGAPAARATTSTPARQTKPTSPEPSKPEPAQPKPQPVAATPAPEAEQVAAAPVAEAVVPAPASVAREPEPAPEPESAVRMEAEPAPATAEAEPVAAAEPAVEAEPAARAEPMVSAPPVPEVGVQGEGEFSRLMDSGSSSAPTLFDDEVPVGRFGPGSADAVPHQGPPDGFTIKGNAQSMLFHTPDSPYYGRTKAEVWFRTEADAERSGFTKYVRKPRKSTQPGN